MRIDAHGHVFAKVSAEFPRQVNEVMPAEHEAPVSELLGHMEKNGIDRAVLVQAGGSAFEHHAYLRHALRAYPDRFRGIALIPPEVWASPEDYMDSMCDDTGIVGFRINTIGGPLDPFAPVDVRMFDAYPIWRHAAERDYVIWLYVGARDAHLIAYLTDVFPQVRVVLNHLGVCPGEGKFRWDEKGRPRIDTPSYNPAFHTTYRLCKYENLTVHLSGQYAFSREEYPYRDLAGWHKSLLNHFGASRLMWATDFPWIYEAPGYGALCNIIREMLPDLKDHEFDEIMGGTARRFLRFPG
ncbi:MAG: amidohydrolase [candidate division Zixibacteria bacterium]|nr:amidohydrolase [candidate division Zixibacteria bacterium]